ncbi:hypothetical protein D3C81_1024860 [compost metagenome]
MRQPGPALTLVHWRQRIDKRHPFECTAYAHVYGTYHGAGCQVLCYAHEMIQRPLAVAYAPILITLVDLADHIHGRHGEHHLPHYRDEQCCQVQRIEACTLEHLQPLMALDRGFVGGGDREDSCIIQHLVHLQATQVGKQRYIDGKIAPIQHSRYSHTAGFDQALQGCRERRPVAFTDEATE